MPKSNYEALRLCLSELEVDEWATTFAELEELLQFQLPASARAFTAAWWSNSAKGRPGTLAWRQAGFRASVNIKEERVTFRRGLEKPPTKKALKAAERANRPPPPDKGALLEKVRELYEQSGIAAISKPALKKARLYSRLWKAKVSQGEILAYLGIAGEFGRDRGRLYGGKFQEKWTWNRIIDAARLLIAQEGELPTVEWCRLNGHSDLTSAVHAGGRTWEDLRVALGSFSSKGRHFSESRNGIRWRSRPEACLSNFLYARGIEHKRGELYDEGYAEASGRRYARYDLHFKMADGQWIDVEVWGDPLNGLSGGRYAETRRLKEQWHRTNPNFLGIPYRNCQSDKKLTKILEPYLGIIEPFVFDKPMDRKIETAHWSNAEELLETCRKLAAIAPGGVYPSESWLRKRGKFKDREGENYNTIAIRVNQWIGGTRKVRELLGQADASTEQWTREKAAAAWRDFERRFDLWPTQIVGPEWIKRIGESAIAEATRIRYGVRKYPGLLLELKGPGRRIKWTRDRIIEEWGKFIANTGFSPTEVMSKAGRKRVTPETYALATQIYSAARNNKLVDTARAAFGK